MKKDGKDWILWEQRYCQRRGTNPLRQKALSRDNLLKEWWIQHQGSFILKSWNYSPSKCRSALRRKTTQKEQQKSIQCSGVSSISSRAISETDHQTNSNPLPLDFLGLRYWNISPVQSILHLESILPFCSAFVHEKHWTFGRSGCVAQRSMKDWLGGRQKTHQGIILENLHALDDEFKGKDIGTTTTPTKSMIERGRTCNANS